MIRKFFVSSLAVLLAATPLEAFSQATASGETAATPVSSSVGSPSGSPRPDDEDLASQTLSTVDVTATRPTDASSGASRLGGRDLATQRAATSDSARLLQDIPGVSLYGAGGISSLPVIHGLADDRLRVEVDGMNLMSACPNHMNSTLSYINPTDVASVTVFAGITPVSAGGDSIGGTIQVKSAPPEFANDEEEILAKGKLGFSSRSNGNGRSQNLGFTLASQRVNLTYSESNSQSNNYKAAAVFKEWAYAGEKVWPAGDEVGSSSYEDSKNRSLGLALRHKDHLLELSVGEQKVGFEGFPNQRMDMTANANTLINLRYTGQYQWGELEARVFDQNTHHKMDMGSNRNDYNTGMPMDSKAKTRGAQINGSIELSERDTFRVGGEYQTYRLDDWWPPVGSGGSMCCDDFWNIRNGERDRAGFFGEWEARWNPEWLSLLGVRSDTVKANAGTVQGYNNNPVGIWKNTWIPNANLFNALDHRRTDHNVDLTALARNTPDSTRTYEVGYAQKTRSPNLYERYPWSANSMAALMNNFVGDGNGYIGNINLKPEVAHTLSATGDWHDAENKKWNLKLTGYHTYVRDFIDAQTCNFNNIGSCGTANPTKTGFIMLQYVNQSARLYGIDLSGLRLLGRSDDLGSFTVTGVLNYVRGENRTTGGNLYHMMPPNTKLSLVQRVGSWTNTAEVQSVAAKKHVSQVRNEVATPGYSLFNLRSSYEWKHARLDIGAENVFNRFYLLPLGGAYVGQGKSMGSTTIPWGVTVPGMGRSINVAMNVNF